LWSGELNAASLRALIESPARAEIAKRLLADVLFRLEHGRVNETKTPDA